MQNQNYLLESNPVKQRPRHTHQVSPSKLGLLGADKLCVLYVAHTPKQWDNIALIGITADEIATYS